MLKTTDYQTFARDSSFYAGCHSKNILELAYLLSAFAGEAGETSDVWKKILRTSYSPEQFQEQLTLRHLDMLNEIGDALWYIARLLDLFGLTFEGVMVLNTHKLWLRHKDAGALAGMPWPYQHVGMPLVQAEKILESIKEAALTNAREFQYSVG